MILLFYLFGDCYFGMLYRHGKMVHTTQWPKSPHQSRKIRQSLAKLIQISNFRSLIYMESQYCPFGKNRGAGLVHCSISSTYHYVCLFQAPSGNQGIIKLCKKWKQIGLTPKKQYIYIYIQKIGGQTRDCDFPIFSLLVFLLFSYVCPMFS